MPTPKDEFAPIEDDGWNTDERCPWCKRLIDDVYKHADKDAFECPNCEKLVVCEEWTQFILKRETA